MAYVPAYERHEQGDIDDELGWEQDSDLSVEDGSNASDQGGEEDDLFPHTAAVMRSPYLVQRTLRLMSTRSLMTTGNLVCKTWYSIIKESSELARRQYLKADMTKIILKCKGYPYYICKNAKTCQNCRPRLLPTGTQNGNNSNRTINKNEFTALITNPFLLSNQDEMSFTQEFPEDSPIIKLIRDIPNYCSFRKMFFSQPPPKKLEVVIGMKFRNGTTGERSKLLAMDTGIQWGDIRDIYHELQLREHADATWMKVKLVGVPNVLLDHAAYMGMKDVRAQDNDGEKVYEVAQHPRNEQV
ncbi:Hypothetical protein D9617_18g033070 [Elsinoe fawcettii]|nr:Hypothetical protein D9617_18g033070 [Elsinoe fawcettii]